MGERSQPGTSLRLALLSFGRRPPTQIPRRLQGFPHGPVTVPVLSLVSCREEAVAAGNQAEKSQGPPECSNLSVLLSSVMSQPEPVPLTRAGGRPRPPRDQTPQAPASLGHGGPWQFFICSSILSQHNAPFVKKRKEKIP